MTKSEYRRYIGSEAWQQRRKQFLSEHNECNRCRLPRWLAVIAYDQDLHVHHRSYANVGAELDEDLEPLCKRCHEIESFGTSALHQVKSKRCSDCMFVDGLVYDMSQDQCDMCRMESYAIGEVIFTINRLSKEK